MSDRTIQRSFRLSSRTLELLDDLAANSPETRNALVDRLLGEAVRAERHPLIRFRRGAAGQRRALLVGTRLYVHQVITTLRAENGDVAVTAGYFDVDEALVRAALAYYADFGDEIDADTQDAERAASIERDRWERQQRALR